MLKRGLIALVALLASVAAFAHVETPPVKVACVGNSITYGYKLPDREVNAYPAQLQRMLGNGYVVGNFGHSGATLLNRGYNPYTKLPEYQAALDFAGDIVVIHLGVNDTDPRCWPNYNSDFIGDYVGLINSFKERNPQARILIALLSPLRASHHRFRTGTRDWRLQIQRAIKTVADITGAELIDFDAPLRDRQDLIFDGIHPDAEGATVLAETVRGAITGDYGGLHLPEIWQSGMIVQRNVPLTLRGRADAGRKITVELDGRKFRAVANNRGDWTVKTSPLVSGPKYTLTVTDGDSTIVLSNILAGEVWLASGQSNMEFPLSVKPVEDSLLRVYDMKPIARTDNYEWPDSVKAETDVLRHYSRTTWGAPTPSFSAVAYHFARQLRDSLRVPVGIIGNAIGGSPTESWIDINSLEASVPEILINPLTNDYLQKWVQGRIRENLGADALSSRHPYEPSYLFAAAIRPLKGFPIAGTIWYQGESNAHNIELHEQLFPLLIDSWRREFENSNMPFYFVQLSSIDRPSWPEFRDSQRRMADAIPYVGMAVSSDVGDSLDVHPTRKAPVGERLARLALHRTYGYDDLADCGPTLASAISANGKMILTFAEAEGLTTADGSSPRTFEVAETEGVYYPAEAEIIDNKIILKNMNVKTPRYVRYAWQPFTRANVVNGAGLPASTFKAEADNASDFEIEPGYENGVSAAFFGRLGNLLVIAGGCNFPNEPLGPKSVKKSYCGIYAAEPSEMQWKRIGTLPRAMAYGASAQTDLGPVWLAPDGCAWLLTDEGLKELPSMPEAVDNAAAAAIGRTVYVAGGNVDGKPSRNVYALDIEQGKWRKLKQMPGNPRVQPVMAAVDDCLYIWGGFAGSGKDATLELDGVKFDTKTEKWTPLPAPTDVDGVPLATGGGVAAALPDGRIAVCGGVNKDVFLAALQNQAPDYLMHPIEWYRFNPNVIVYNPESGLWEVALTSPDAARAGAALISDAQGALYLYGGELKPRIRTAEVLKLEF